MITKALFLNSIETIRRHEGWIDQAANLGINLWEIDEIQELRNNLVEMLEYCCEDYPVDRYDSSDISYFIYDAEFGSKCDTYYITLNDGTKVKWHNAEELWDWLVYKHPGIEDKSVS